MVNRKLALVVMITLLSILLVVQVIAATSSVDRPNQDEVPAGTGTNGQTMAGEAPGPQPTRTTPPSRDVPRAPLGGSSILVPE